MTEPTDVRELREKIERADQMVTNLCKPRYTPNAREWTMSIPARPDHDPDLVIGAGLDAGRAALERLEGLEEAGRMALSVLDGLLGDSDLPDDNRPGTLAMRALSAALAAPAASEREREPDATYRKALENALIHTAHLPHASRDLLEGLLASVARICKEALGIDTARTPEPAGDSEPTAAILCEIADEFDRSPEPWENERAVRVRKAAAALERLEKLEEHNHAIMTRAGRLESDLAAGEASDGYHTHRELYEYRMLYNAHAARGWLAAGIPVVKSWKHSDGEPCFGGGWFIVTAELPTGQVSNHYAAEHWHLFDVPEVDLPPEYDGHTPADAAERLRAALAAPAPAPQGKPEYETALDTLLGPQPENFAELLARRYILQHQLTLVEQALDRIAPAPAPQQGRDG